jgi:hypothetical protein
MAPECPISPGRSRVPVYRSGGPSSMEVGGPVGTGFWAETGVVLE